MKPLSRAQYDQLPFQIIDAHVHIWTDGASPYPYGDLVPSPRSSVFVEDLLCQMDSIGISKAILVQPSVHGYDNKYIADTIRRYPQRFIGVCRVRPSKPNAVLELQKLANEDGFRGLRLNLRQDADLRVWDNPGLWRAARDLGIVITLLLDPHQLVLVSTVANNFPSVPIVIDHLARIFPNQDRENEARGRLVQLGKLPNIHVKLSAFHALSQEPFPWPDIHPLIQAMFDEYGPRRLMWASDYPIDQDTHLHSLQLMQEFPGWKNEDRAWILGQTAANLFTLSRR